MKTYHGTGPIPDGNSETAKCFSDQKQKSDGSSSIQIFRHLLADPGTGLFGKVIPKTGGDIKLDLLAFKVTVGRLFSRG